MSMMRDALTTENYDREYSNQDLVGRIGLYFRPWWRRLLGITGMVTVLALFDAAAPVLIARGVGLLANVDQDTSSLIMLLAGALLVLRLFYWAANWGRRLWTAMFIGDVTLAMRKDAFDAAMARDLSFYDDNKTGKVVSRITTDTQELSQVILITADIVTQTLEFLLILIVLLTREWRLTLLLLGSMPIVVALALSFRHFARLVTRQGSRSLAVVNDNIQESVTGITVAKNFRQEKVIYEDFSQVNRQSYEVNIRRGFVFALIFPVMNALSGFVIAMVVHVGALMAIEGAILLGAWFLFIQGVDRFWFPVINLSSFWSQLQGGCLLYTSPSPRD